VLAANVESFATCALRPSVVFGPGEYQFNPSLYACISKGETPFIIGDGLNLWDVTCGFPDQYLTTIEWVLTIGSYVDNVADARVLAVDNLLTSRTAAGEAIFIIDEQPIPFRDFCLVVC
jgi:sterol-4alpha-carboxylate 3-dehydrogenase (decarboxylating)